MAVPVVEVEVEVEVIVVIVVVTVALIGTNASGCSGPGGLVEKLVLEASLRLKAQNPSVHPRQSLEWKKLCLIPHTNFATKQQLDSAVPKSRIHQSVKLCLEA